MKCLLCGSETAVRRFAITVDGEPLRLQPDFCQEHGDGYLMTVGLAIGEFIRKNGVSGRPVSPGLFAVGQFFEFVEEQMKPERPDSTISGRQEDGACWAFKQGQDGLDYYCARGIGHLEHYNGNVGGWATPRQEDDPEFGRARREFEAMRAERLGETPRRHTYGPPAHKSRDDATYVLEAVLPNCPQCEGRGYIDVLISPHLNGDRRRETCLTCEGRGHL